jgi:hypothetical protein
LFLNINFIDYVLDMYTQNQMTDNIVLYVFRQIQCSINYAVYQLQKLHRVHWRWQKAVYLPCLEGAEPQNPVKKNDQ